jgi:uncharacterized protein
VAGSSAQLHESAEVLGAENVDRHRAVVSIMEELEAIDWYDQRVRAASDGELAAILEHNRDEEKEHAAMALEWLRRRDPALDRHLRTYLFTDAPIAATAAAVDDEAEPADAPGSTGSLGLGSLRGHELR